MRSWLKALSWRAIATATTMALVYALTGQLERARFIQLSIDKEHPPS